MNVLQTQVMTFITGTEETSPYIYVNKRK
jgi:hypothetical protein